jgi:hypothetical protein
LASICSSRITGATEDNWSNATTTINGKEIFDLLRDDIAAIEEQFGRDTVSNVTAITEIGEYLRAGGGKRIRPALLLLSAKLFGYKGDGAVKLATVVEIIHTATLVHDDIIDEAQIRRGRPAANTQWGNSMCVLAGDWLYMQAFKIAVQERNFRILDVLDRTDAADGRRRTAPDGETRQADLAAGASRSDLSQDGLPVLGVHASRRHSRRRHRATGGTPRPVRTRSRH